MDRAFQRHMMAALATHPNAGAALVLGPDRRAVARVCDAVEAAGRPVAGLSLDDAHEDRFEFLTRAGRAAARLPVARRYTRRPLAKPAGIATVVQVLAAPTKPGVAG